MYRDMRRLLLIVIGQVFSGSVIAASDDVATMPDPMSMGTLLQVFISLAVVLLMFAGLIALIRRFSGQNPNNTHQLKIIEGISVGTRDRIVLMQCGDEQILVGLSPGRISKLHVLDKPVSVAVANAENETPQGFLQQFQTAIGRQSSRQAS